MKILVVEDSDRKYENTVKYLKGYLVENDIESSIERVETINEAKIALSENQYTHAVIDMMFPRRANERVINTAGIEILSYIKRKSPDVKYTFNSSSETGMKYLKDAGYENEPYIVHDIMYDLQDDFNDFLSN